ncbi:uncharacterized protein BJ212DRAFT_1300366 [Suillus subaureus]|uniref:Uncharacterized protein n=1 Tax=Suillus subaureus TaxID=48587 RepID=A0A9P7E9Q3_9AGAM|nr:uncharacterized protein BJ212DRAFT_1300366 [Suillus subaureus]KAG1815209.1 hypothetical protein BJ212DRAFT_1300366 [Suillus subaureus]
MIVIQNISISDPNAPAEVPLMNGLTFASHRQDVSEHPRHLHHAAFLGCPQEISYGVLVAVPDPIHIPKCSATQHLLKNLQAASCCISPDVLEKLATEFWTRCAFNNSLALLRSGQLLTNLQAAALRVVASSEHTTTLCEGEFMSFDSIIGISLVEAPSIWTSRKRRPRLRSLRHGNADSLSRTDHLERQNDVVHEEGDEHGAGEDSTDSLPVDKSIDYNAILYTSTKEGRL